MEEIIASSDIVINFPAESDFDNSIASHETFISSNYLGVFNILELVRKYDKRFHQVSTDEVYGSLPLHSLEQIDEKYCYKSSESIFSDQSSS